jgi:hypothetical protein
MYCLHLEKRRVSQVSNNREASSKQGNEYMKGTKIAGKLVWGPFKVTEEQDGRKEETNRALKMLMLNKINGKKKEAVEIMLQKDGR